MFYRDQVRAHVNHMSRDVSELLIYAPLTAHTQLPSFLARLSAPVDRLSASLSFCLSGLSMSAIDPSATRAHGKQAARV